MASNNAKKAGKEIVTIQIFRAFAAVAVIFAHLSATHVLWQIGYVGVDIFFALSGFVMIASTGNLRHRPNASSVFLRRRFIRVVPMYWLFTGLAMLYEGHQHRVFHADEIVHSLLFLPFRQGQPAEHYFPILAVGWTLVFEVFFYLCFAVCLKLRVSPFLLAPVFVALSFVGFHHRVHLYALLSLFSYLLLEFIAGMVFAWLYLHGRLLAWRYAVLLCVACIGVFFVWPINGYEVHLYAWVPASLLFLYGALSFERFLAGHLPRSVEILADASYSIYLCHHQFVLAALEQHFPNLHAKTYLFCFLEVFLCCVAGVLVHYAVERPILRRFKVWIGGHAPA